MPPPLLIGLGSTPYNGIYSGTVLLGILSSFILFRQSHHLKSCTGPHIIAMHSNQYNFTYKDSYHIVSRSVVMTSTFITIIPWLFHSPLTCRLVYNTNSYISMHYHHVIAYNHNLNSVSTYQQLNIKFSS
jgi:hypothetical protein